MGVMLGGMLLYTLFSVLGGVAAGVPLAYLTELPPANTRISHKPLSIWLFLGGTFLAVLLGGLCIYRLKLSKHFELQRPKLTAAFPFWGYLALALLLSSWAAAWFWVDELSSLRYFTFSGIWLGYIFLASALHFSIVGSTPLVSSYKEFLLLFPISALFWWTFEIVNRLVENWSYINLGEVSALGYASLASLSFSTVLPAVLITKLLLETFVQKQQKIKNTAGASALSSRKFWLAVLVLSLFTLLLIAVYPTELYPFVWVAPALAVPALQELSGKKSVYSACASGDFNQLTLWAVAGLSCGFLWEFWNYYSTPKWVYHISYLDYFRIFEMPLLGYLGYIPFGFLCGTVLIAFFPECSTEDRTQ